MSRPFGADATAVRGARVREGQPWRGNGENRRRSKRKRERKAARPARVVSVADGYGGMADENDLRPM